MLYNYTYILMLQLYSLHMQIYIDNLLWSLPTVVICLKLKGVFNLITNLSD